jgi:hypothetical protein
MKTTPKKAIMIEKNTYMAPILDCYGNISNFTTGGSGKRSEYELVTMGGMMGMGGTEECMQTSMNMNRNTQMC